MAILVNFEDKYGITDLVCNKFFNICIADLVGSEDYFEIPNTDIFVRCDLGTGKILNPVDMFSSFDTIVYVYDMDGSGSSEYNILSPDALRGKITRLEKHYKDKILKFVPICFCAETICLYLLQNNILNFSVLFNSVNTAKMHTEMYRSDLRVLFPDVIKIKRTHEYIHLFQDINKVYTQLQNLGYLKYVKHLFEWLMCSSMSDTSKLLSRNDAIALQIDYYNDYMKFIKCISTSNITFTYNKDLFDITKSYKR